MGSGVFSEKLDAKIAYRLSDIFRAKITALNESLTVLIRKVFKTKNICIFPDSQMALKSLKCFRVSSKLVKECPVLLVNLTLYFMINQ